jgi:hypothetical protein
MKQFQCNIDLYCPQENSITTQINGADNNYVCGFQQGAGEDIELVFSILNNGTLVLASDYVIELYKVSSNLLDYRKSVEYVTTLNITNSNQFTLNKDIQNFKTLFSTTGTNEIICYVNGSPTTGWNYFVHANPTYYFKNNI